MFWRNVALLAGGIALMAVGLGIAYRYDLEWVRVLSMTAPIALVGLAAMALKRRQQRADRTDEPDSIEHDRDVRARAGAYVIGLAATAVALAVGVMLPGVSSWILLLSLLAVLVVGYGVSRLWVDRDARQ